jgi:hypothetical protein
MSTDCPTELDEALEASRRDPTHANFFYDAFLNATLLFPALRTDKRPGEWERLPADARFFPMYLRRGEARAIPVFDRLDRLKAWAHGKTFDYLVLPGSVLIRVIAPEIAIVLNEGTAYRYLLVPEILEKLRAAMRPVPPQ